jgi:hypothetical protein
MYVLLWYRLKVSNLTSLSSSLATANQHPPVQHEGWMDGKWSGNSFLLGSISLANHGG